MLSYFNNLWLKLKNSYDRKKYRYLLKNHKKIIRKVINHPSILQKRQFKNPNTIPIIIINYNQLFYLKKLISFLEKVDSKKIVILDNNSTYKPLLTYYDELCNNNNIVIHRLHKNYGHLVLWKNKKLFKKYTKGFFVLTDADIVPNNNLDKDYLYKMLEILLKYPDKSKVGFALRLDNIPDQYTLKEKVIQWESKFWEKKIESTKFNEDELYDADIDTTFALYWPKFYRIHNMEYPQFFNAIRLGGNFIAEHGGWYIDNNNLTQEQKYYFATSNSSNSWKFDENGNLIDKFKDIY